MADNDFPGTVPWQIFQNLTRLHYLGLRRDSLRGTLDFTHLPSSLKFLRLDGNAFNGSINGNGWRSLQLMTFDVSYNSFNGPVQWDIFKGIQNLKMIKMNENNLNGTINWNIISDLHNNGSLRQLLLHNNNFSGYVDFSWMKEDLHWSRIEIDRNIPCM